MHRWSISDLDGFWDAVWDFTGVIGNRGAGVLLRCAEGKMFGAHWYPEAILNFAENMLCGDDARLAIVEATENGVVRRVSIGDLRYHVVRAQAGMRRLGVRRGGILSNNVDALVALLAVASLDWSSWMAKTRNWAPLM